MKSVITIIKIKQNKFKNYKNKGTEISGCYKHVSSTQHNLKINVPHGIDCSLTSSKSLRTENFLVIYGAVHCIPESKAGFI